MTLSRRGATQSLDKPPGCDYYETSLNYKLVLSNALRFSAKGGSNMAEYIHSSTKRTMAYWYVDGLAELCMGVVLFLLGVVLLIEGPAPQDSTLATVMAALRYLAILGGTFAIGVALRYLKGNVIYPRTGYVIYKKPGFKEMAPGFVAVVVLVLLLDAWVRATMPEKAFLFVWLMAGLTLFFAFLFISWARETGFRRFSLLSALVIMAGLATTGLGLAYIMQDNLRAMLAGPGMFLAAVGLIATISGALVFGQYMGQTVRQDNEPL
jgi:hypothetical protein